MKKSQEKFMAIAMWIGLLIIIATLIVFLLPSPQETTQKQHNFPVGDDTEHTWIGGDGESFEE